MKFNELKLGDIIKSETTTKGITSIAWWLLITPAAIGTKYQTKLIHAHIPDEWENSWSSGFILGEQSWQRDDFEYVGDKEGNPEYFL